MGLWRNHRGDLAPLECVDQRIGVVSLVTDQGLRIGAIDQQLRASQIVGLPWREHHIDTIAERIDQDVNFGGQSAARSADRLRAVFFSCPGTVLVSAHDGGIDHHVFVVVIARQLLENALENSALRPSTKALMNDLPIPKALRQIAPGNAQ